MGACPSSSPLRAVEGPGQASPSRSPVLFYSLALACLLFRSAAAQPLDLRDPVRDFDRAWRLSARHADVSFANQPVERADSVTGGPLQWRQRTARKASSDRLFVEPMPVVLSSTWSSTRPAGSNDGLAWRGRGFSTSAAAGLYLRSGGLSAALYPELVWTQNRDYETWPGTDQTRYPLRPNLDVPQRTGDGPRLDAGLGQSFVRLDAWGWSAGISTQNLWWGPAIRNALIMSNHAPGLPHVFIGTDGATDVGLGRLEMRTIWGTVRRSEYFDEPGSLSPHRFVAGATVAWQPFENGILTIGANRVFSRYVSDSLRLKSGDFLVLLQGPFKKNIEDQAANDYDQMASGFARLKFARSALEVYGEYARGDHSWDLRDLTVHLKHAGGYTIGLQKLFARESSRWTRFGVEWTRLEGTRDELTRPNSARTDFFYVHSQIVEGYTHRGQLMGAWIGPGSNSQELWLDRYSEHGLVGLTLRRTVFDNNRMWGRLGDQDPVPNVELAVGARWVRFGDRIEFDSMVEVQRGLNRFNEKGNSDVNVFLGLTLRRRSS